MSEFIKACPVSQVKEGEGKLVSINGVPVAIFKFEEDFYAINNVCTHAGGPLCEGHVEDKRVACPWHGWEFDLSTGECRFPSKNVQTYDTKVDEEFIWVKIE